MQEMQHKVQGTIESLGESQERLEEIAYDMLNISDIIENQAKETKKALEALLDVDSIEEKEEIVKQAKQYLKEVIKASEQMAYFVRQNEKHFSIQKECIEEAKQICDFLYCFLDNKR